MKLLNECIILPVFGFSTPVTYEVTNQGLVINSRYVDIEHISRDGSEKSTLAEYVNGFFYNKTCPLVPDRHIENILSHQELIPIFWESVGRKILFLPDDETISGIQYTGIMWEKIKLPIKNKIIENMHLAVFSQVPI